jgi:hypothetical protein
MALTLTIDSVDRTSVLKANSCKVRRSLNQRASADLFIDAGESGYSPVVGNSVEIANGATKIFGGEIHSITKWVEPGTSSLNWRVRCLDWSHICDRRIVTEVIPSTSPATDIAVIVDDIVNRFLNGEGITTSGVFGGYPVTVDLPFLNRPVSECFDRLSKLSGWQWIIDPDKDLFFGPAVTSPITAAPFSLTASSDNWRNLFAIQSLSQYRNVQVVQTRTPLETPVVDAWDMYDAAANVFWYPTTAPVTEAPTVKVNGVTKTIGELTNNTPPYPGTHDFYWLNPTVEEDILYGVYVDDVNDWSSSDDLTIEYSSQLVYQVVRTDATAIADRAAIEGGSGRHEAVEDQNDLSTVASLNAHGDGLLRAHKNLPTEVTFQTDEFGLEPGQAIGITYAPIGLSGNYLIESVDYKWIHAVTDFFRCDVKCSDQEIFGRSTRLMERVVSMARRGNVVGGAAAGDTSFIISY